MPRASRVTGGWRQYADARLCELAGDGDSEAFAELYRRHLRAARGVARHVLGYRGDVDDVVSDAFAGVLRALRNGHGPRDEFRWYLLACVRNACKQRRPSVVPMPDEQLERRALEDPERYVEADTVARAFAALRPRWQQTLWLSEVERWPLEDVGRRLRLSANAAAALSSRARKAFATAYLAEHQAMAATPACSRTWPRLAPYVRDALGTADRAEVERHLSACTSCTRAVDELSDLNTSLRSLQLPAAATLVTAAGRGVGTTFTLPVGAAGLLSKWALVAIVAVPTVAAGAALVEQSPRTIELQPAAPRIDPPQQSAPSVAVIAARIVGVSPANSAAALPPSVAGTDSQTGTEIVPLGSVLTVSTAPAPTVTVPLLTVPVPIPALPVPTLTAPQPTLSDVTVPELTVTITVAVAPLPVTVPPAVAAVTTLVELPALP